MKRSIHSRAIRWLHLSDFHVGKDEYAQRQMFERILKHVESKSAEGSKPDFLFITGDLANKGQRAEYDIFNRDLLIPLQTLLGSDIGERTFVVPGNHDVDRTKNQALDRKEMIEPKGRYFDPTDEGKSLRELLHPRFKAYSEQDLNGTKRQWVLSSEGSFAQVQELNGLSIGIAGINTAWLSKDDNDRAQLTPGKALVEHALQQLKHCHVRLVLGHHPIEWLFPNERRMISALFGQSGIIYLHGHLHEIWAEPQYGGGTSFLSIQSAAAFQAREGEPWLNGLVWGWLDLKRNRIGLQPWTWKAAHQGWVLAADAFPDNHRNNDCWEYPLPGTNRTTVFTQPQKQKAKPGKPKRQPKAMSKEFDAHVADREKLLERARNVDDAQLVSDLLTGGWTLSQLEEAIDGRADRALRIVTSVAEAGGETWRRLLAAFVAMRVAIPSGEIISVALEESILKRPLRWGSQLQLMTLLRFVPAPKRMEVVRNLLEVANSDDFDRKRVSIYGLGFLGRHQSISLILDQNHALQDKYANEKLGPFAVLAFLRCYLELTDESMEWAPLDNFTRTFRATEALHNLTLGFFDYSDELQCLRPGKAVRLFRHFRDNGHEASLSAVLSAISHRPNPLLLDELIELGSRPGTPEVSAGALHAASNIGTAAAEERLRSCMEQALPGAKAAWLLAVGLSQDLSAADQIASAIGDKSLPRDASWLDDVRHNAIWAAGELGRANPQFAESVLRPVCNDAYDPYGRALAWLGLAKARRIASQAECHSAFESASNFFERTILAVASSIAGWPDLLVAGIRGTIENAAPLYRLLAHIERDVRIALQAHAGEGGKALVTLLDLGDFT
jgi:predicted phosphodiesterase